ncbi:pyridoxal-phosphate dependent enzyme [Chloroflexota bacterium]
MAKPHFMECVECGHRQDHKPMATTKCHNCGSLWVEAHYDYASFKRELLRGLPDRPFNIWRYHDVLPVSAPPEINFEEAGGTPIRKSRRYAAQIKHENLYIKDERYGPTSSFKDRQAAVAVAAMAESGIKEAVIASTGNAAVAYAAACAQAGIKLWVFMTSMVPPEKLREVALFGAEVVKVTGTYDQTKQIAAEFACRRGLQLDRGAGHLPSRESMKTIAYEIIEQLGWQAPSWYIQSVSGGLGPMGVFHGFQELYDMGLIDRIPKLGVIQSAGCAPMVQAFNAGNRIADPVTPETRIAILSTGDPGKTYSYLWDLIQQHGGTMESVSDSEAFATMRDLAKADGLAVEPATAVGFAGFEKLVRNKVITQDEVVVVNCTGHTFPVEKHVLQDQWAVDLQLSKEDKATSRQEGLQAALDTLDEKTTTVLIVDDNQDAAHLIRRLLENKKKYRVFEAVDGRDGLEQAIERLPDLIILDLMMPDMDGFSVLEALKADDITQNIPVIVVSAKDITEDEWNRLRGQIEGLFQKGSLPHMEFVDQVVEVIEQKISKGDVE